MNSSPMATAIRVSIHIIGLGVLIIMIGCRSGPSATSEIGVRTAETGNTWFPSVRDFAVDDLSGLGAAGVAKELCTAVFVSGDDPGVFLNGSSKFWMLPEDKEGLRHSVDHEAKSVSLTLANGTVAHAKFVGVHGCVVLGPRGENPKIDYRPLATDVLDMTEDWPIGDRLVDAEILNGLDQAALDRAVELAFAEDAHTLSFLVIHRGEIVAERYAPGISAETRLPGWSMTKTLQSTIVGRAEKQGRLNLYERIGLPEWSSEDDPRGSTTLADLLRMSAPFFCGNGDPQFDYDGWRSHGYPFYLYTFSGPEDAYEYSVNRPPLKEGEPRGYYANCQPHVTGRVLKDEFEETGETLPQWANEHVFAPLGMRSVVLELDRVGNALTAGYSLATTRDWGRLGLLYVQDGVWQGERLLSKEFISLTRAPAPYWEEPVYGGQVWLRQDDCSSWSCDTFEMKGIEGQRVMISPSRDLVVVRLGRGVGDPPSPDPNRVRPALVALDAAGAELMKAIPTKRHPESDAIEAALEGFFNALGAEDRQALEATISEDFTLFEEGRVWDADKLFDVIVSPPAWNRRWTISQASIVVAGDQATISYRNTLRATNADNVRVREWLESAVLQKSGDHGWVVSFLHSTPIRQVDDNLK